jgi:hypothetical protein
VELFTWSWLSGEFGSFYRCYVKFILLFFTSSLRFGSLGLLLDLSVYILTLTLGIWELRFCEIGDLYP